MESQSSKSLNDVISFLRQKSTLFSNYLFDLFMSKIDLILIFSLIISVSFSIYKTVFITGYTNDSYQIFALSIEKFIKTGEQDYLFSNYYVKNRILFPLIIAIVHIIIPIDIAFLACFINLFFALSSLYLLRILLRIYEFSEDEVNIFSLLVILSYNFINYWFTILTDVPGLTFFLIMLIFLELYLSKKDFPFQVRFSYLILSFVFLFFAVLTRELYFFAILLYFAVIRSKKIRIIVVIGSIWVFFLVIDQVVAEFSKNMTSLPKEYYSLFLNSDWGELFNSINQKWTNPTYNQNFIKGLIKVSILPPILIVIIVFISILTEKVVRGVIALIRAIPEIKLNLISDRTTFKSVSHKLISLKLPSFKFYTMVVWLFIYFFVFTFLYYNPGSPTGLRYWLPISWIPLALVTKSIIQQINSRYVRIFLILFLCSYPYAWSSMELYINRNVLVGTGPLFQQNYHLDNMSDINSITQYSSHYINISVVNNSYFKTVSMPGAYEEDVLGYRRSKFSFFLWLNSTKNFTLEVRLRSTTNAQWGFSFHKLIDDYSPVMGETVFGEWHIATTPQFQTYKYSQNQTVFLRYISFNIEGEVGTTVIWDYFKVIVD